MMHFGRTRTSLISFIGHGTGDSLAVGSGEGRVSRVLKECGYRGGALFVLPKSYFGRERFEDAEVRNGLKMHFAGWSQPLETYMAALENARLTTTSLREPESPSRIRLIKAPVRSAGRRSPSL